MAKVNYNNMKKEQLIELLKEKDDKLSKLNERLVKIEEQLKASSTDASVIQRIDNVERSCFKQEQYSRRECVEFVGLPANIAGQDLENKVIEAFGVAGVKVTSRDFHAIHRLKNEAVVIAKCVNRRDATAILRAKKQLREADEPTKISSARLERSTSTNHYAQPTVASSECATPSSARRNCLLPTR